MMEHRRSSEYLRHTLGDFHYFLPVKAGIM
jgi:hypothetical protein